MAEARFHFAAAVVFSLLVTAFLQTDFEEDGGEELGPLTRNAVWDAKLKQIVEGFRANMSQPTPSLGLPALDPFHLDKLAVNLSLNGISAQGELLDLNIAGLSTFVIDKISIKIVGLHLVFRFFVEEITATTRLNVSVGDTLHISGDNTYTLTADDLALSGDIAIGVRDNEQQNIYLTNVTLDFSYGIISVALGQEFSFDDRLTKAVQSVINDLLPQALDRKKQALMTWADDQLMTLGNNLLQNITFAQIIG